MNFIISTLLRYAKNMLHARDSDDPEFTLSSLRRGVSKYTFLIFPSFSFHARGVSLIAVIFTIFQSKKLKFGQPCKARYNTIKWHSRYGWVITQCCRNHRFRYVRRLQYRYHSGIFTSGPRNSSMKQFVGPVKRSLHWISISRLGNYDYMTEKKISNRLGFT